MDNHTIELITPEHDEPKAPPPLKRLELLRRVKPRDALRDAPVRPLELRLVLPGVEQPKVEVTWERLGVPFGSRRARGSKAGAYEIKLAVQGGVPVGRHAFPPSAQVRALSARRRIHPEEGNGLHLAGWLPEHLALRPLPERLPRDLKGRRRLYGLASLAELKGRNEATTVFAPDDRYTFADTAFPWCTTGRVDTPGGQGSGAMIGPRHLLTCSHVIQWNSDGTAGWVKFTPSYFDGSEPFGTAWGEWVYFEKKVFGPGIDNDEGRHDYVVVVLNTRMGDLTGWMGSRTYSSSWDGGLYWSHIGYPGDLSAGARPSFQGSFALSATSDPAEHRNIQHQADIWPGQSGGPVFGWWEGEEWPRAVSVQSWQNVSTNGSGGGSHMVDLIIRARADFP